MAHGRRSFLKAAGITTAAVSAGPLALALPSAGPGDGGPGEVLAAPAATTLAPVMLLSLDGEVCPLSSYEGGMPEGEVIEYRDGADPIARKMIGRPIFGNIVMEMPMSLVTPGIWEWIDAMMKGTPTRKNGAVILADFNYKERRRVDFSDALITEVTFPALDGASKDAAYLKLELAIGSSAVAAGSGTAVPAPATSKQKQWHCANFSIKIGDLPTKRVSKVDAFTIKQGIIEFEDGTSRTPMRVPGRLEFPNITISVPDADYDAYGKWLQSHVLDGNDEEFAGTLELLSPDLKTVLWTLSFYGLGIFKLEPVPGATNKAGATWEASMYCEQMLLPSAAGVPS